MPSQLGKQKPTRRTLLDGHGSSRREQVARPWPSRRACIGIGERGAFWLDRYPQAAALALLEAASNAHDRSYRTAAVIHIK